MEELCLLTCSMWLAQPTFFIAVRATNLGAAPPITHSELGPPILITNQEIAQACPKANLVRRFSQLMSLLLRWLQLVLRVDIKLASPGTNTGFSPQSLYSHCPRAILWGKTCPPLLTPPRVTELGLGGRVPRGHASPAVLRAAGVMCKCDGKATALTERVGLSGAQSSSCEQAWPAVLQAERACAPCGLGCRCQVTIVSL